MTRASCVLLLLFAVPACSESDNSPTSPDNTPTRILSIAGDLNFGTVPLRQAKNAGFTIANTGNSALTISGFTGPCAGNGVFKFSWTNGTIAAGAAQSVIVTFSPTVPVNCTGTVTIHGDQTSGGDTIPITAVGVVF